MTDPVWSIFIMMILLLICVVYYVAYILRMAYTENGSNGTPESEELLQLQGHRD